MAKYYGLVVLCWLYVVTTNATFWGIPGPGPRVNHCFLQISPTTGLLFGGENLQYTSENDVHIYDFVTNRWLSVTTFGVSPSPRVSPSCFVYNSTVYVYGGYTNEVYGLATNVLTDMYSLNIPSLTWTVQPSSPVQQAGAASVFLDDVLVMFGGQPDEASLSAYALDSCTNVTMLYYPYAHVWMELIPPNEFSSPPARCFASMTAIGTKAYLTGGALSGPSFNNVINPIDMWQLDTVSMVWTEITTGGSLPIGRGSAVWLANPVTEKLYLLAGSNGLPLQDAHVFNANLGNLSWSPLTTLPVGIIGAQGVLSQDTVWYYGGYNGNVVTGNVQSFSLNSPNQIQDLSVIDDTISTTNERILYGAALYNATWFVFGGAKNTISEALSDLIALDLTTFSWSVVTQSGAVPPALFGHSFTTVGTKGVLFGGSSASYGQNYNETYALNFQTGYWSLVNTVGPGPFPIEGHNAVAWGQEKLIIYGGINCCDDFSNVWILDFTPSTPTWSNAPVVGPIPPPRYNACATIFNNLLYIFGGAHDLSDVWALDLTFWVWTQLFPVSSPPGRLFAASVLIGQQWYINGGEGSSGAALSDTWVYNLESNTWTQVKTLDPNSPTPQPVMQHECVQSPFGDQLLIIGPGLTTFSTQFLSPGFHDIAISQTAGSDATCQMDETYPCKTFAFALSHFAGNSYLEFTVSADITSIFTISTSQIVKHMQFSVPILIQGSTSNVQLDCQATTCFTLSNILSNPFTLSNVILLNGNGPTGGAIMATNSLVSLQSVTVQNNRAQQQGGAIYLQGSTLSLANVAFIDNYATLSGGAIFADKSSTIISQWVQFTGNVAGMLGGAICAIATSLTLTNTNFTYNALSPTATMYGSGDLIGGGAVYVVDGTVTIAGCSFYANTNLFSSDTNINYGAALLLYTSVGDIRDTDFLNNDGGSGGGVAVLSVSSSAANALATVISTSSVYFENNLWKSNSAYDSGGGLFISDTSSVAFVACALINNVATTNGGGAILSTSSVTITNTTFTSNVCTAGNGGALTLLGTAATFAHGCSFDDNHSPSGGGGAIYIGPDSGASTNTVTAPVQPIFDASTVFALTNTGLYGDKFAAQPVSINMTNSTFITRIPQIAGVAMDPPPSFGLFDKFGNLVSNLPAFVTISVVNSTSTSSQSSSRLGGKSIVETVDGLATFDDLIVIALPGSILRLQCTTSLPEELGGTVLSTTVITFIVQACLPPLEYYDKLNGVCDYCPPQYTTKAVMQLQCQFQFLLDQPITWNLNAWYGTIGGILIGIGLYMFAIPKTVHYLYRMNYNDKSWTVYSSMFVIGCAHATYGWVLVCFNMASLKFGAVESGQFQSVDTQVSSAYFSASLLVACACATVTCILFHYMVFSRGSKHLPSSPVSGNKVVSLMPTHHDKMNKRGKSEYSTTVSHSGSLSGKTDSIAGADLSRPDERVENILKNLGKLDLSSYLLASSIQAISTVATIDLVFLASSEFSEWTITYSRPAFYLAGGFILTWVYTGILVLLFRVGWGKPKPTDPNKPAESQKWLVFLSEHRTLVRCCIAILPAGTVAIVQWILLAIANNSSDIKFKDIPNGDVATMSNLIAIFVVCGVALLVVGLFLVTNQLSSEQINGNIYRAMDNITKISCAAFHMVCTGGRLLTVDSFAAHAAMDQHPRPAFFDLFINTICASPYTKEGVVDHATEIKLMHRMVNMKTDLREIFQTLKIGPLVIWIPTAKEIKDAKERNILLPSTLTRPPLIVEEPAIGSATDAQLQRLLPFVHEERQALRILMDWMRENRILENIEFLIDSALYRASWHDVKKDSKRLINAVDEMSFTWIFDDRKTSPPTINVDGATMSAMKNTITEAKRTNDASKLTVNFFDAAARCVFDLIIKNAIDKYNGFIVYRKGLAYKEFVRIMTSPLGEEQKRDDYINSAAAIDMDAEATEADTLDDGLPSFVSTDSPLRSTATRQLLSESKVSPNIAPSPKPSSKLMSHVNL